MNTDHLNQNLPQIIDEEDDEDVDLPQIQRCQITHEFGNLVHWVSRTLTEGSGVQIFEFIGFSKFRQLLFIDTYKFYIKNNNFSMFVITWYTWATRQQGCVRAARALYGACLSTAESFHLPH